MTTLRRLAAVSAFALFGLTGCVPSAQTSMVPSPAGATSSAAPASTDSAPTTAAPAASVSTAPVRVTVPSAGIDQAVVPRGLSSAGKIDPDPGQVMWYTGNGRVAPGLVGTAVVAGHLVANGKPDVFANLDKTAVGDHITITTAEGAVDYRVTRTSVADKNAVASDPLVWGSNSTSRRVVLVTCDDTLGFRPDGHRLANLVVVAEAS